jgi:hypothetical protein
MFTCVFVFLSACLAFSYVRIQAILACFSNMVVLVERMRIFEPLGAFKESRVSRKHQNQARDHYLKSMLSCYAGKHSIAIFQGCSPGKHVVVTAAYVDPIYVLAFVNTGSGSSPWRLRLCNHLFRADFGRFHFPFPSYAFSFG